MHTVQPNAVFQFVSISQKYAIENHFPRIPRFSAFFNQSDIPDRTAHGRDAAICASAGYPVFAEEYKAKIRAKNQHYNELAKQKRKELRESAETDPQAAEELAAQRAKATEYVLSSRKRIKENAAVDPAAAAKREHYLEYRRRYDTERKHNLIAAAQTDPLAAERLAMERRNAVEATQRWKAKRKEGAASAAI